MKTKSILGWSTGLLSAATLAAGVCSAAADQTAASSTNDKQFTGQVDSINTAQHTVTINSLFRHRTFDLGNNCAITRWDKTAGTINDLRPGQTVTVGYQQVNGLLAADRVVQKAMRYNSIVRDIDPVQHRLFLVSGWSSDMKFVLPQDCKVTVQDKEDATLASIKPGDRVTVVYETTDAGPDSACQIIQNTTKHVFEWESL